MSKCPPFRRRDIEMYFWTNAFDLRVRFHCSLSNINKYGSPKCTSKNKKSNEQIHVYIRKRKIYWYRYNWEGVGCLRIPIENTSTQLEQKYIHKMFHINASYPSDIHYLRRITCKSEKQPYEHQYHKTCNSISTNMVNSFLIETPSCSWRRLIYCMDWIIEAKWRIYASAN